MDSSFAPEEFGMIAQSLAQQGPVLVVKVSDSFRYTEPAFLDSWQDTTKLSDKTSIISHVPGKNDFCRYAGLDPSEIVFQDEPERLPLPMLEAPLRQTIMAMCAVAESPEIDAVQACLVRGLDRLVPFVGVAVASAFGHQGFYHRLLLGGPDLVTVTAFSGQLADLATRELPSGKYEDFLHLLANHNPYVLEKKRAGSPYRALVNVLLAVAWDNREWQPGLAILPIKSSGSRFQALIPAIDGNP